MATPLNLLIAEDSTDDVELMIAELRRAGFAPTHRRVDTEADFLAELQQQPELILSDYSMPQFSGLRAAWLAQESGLDIPFILVSGTVGEDAAVEAMRCGATDYLLKDRIARLGTAVERALEQKRLRIERKRSEEELRWKTALLEAQVHSSLDGLLVVDNQGKIILHNQRIAEMWNIPHNLKEIPDDARQLQFVMNQTRRPKQFVEKVAFLYAHPDEISRDEIELIDGRVFDRYSAPVKDNSGTHYGRIWTFRDITREKQAEAALRFSEAQLRATFESAAIGIALVDREGRPIKCNPALIQMLGFSEAELCRMSFSEFSHPEDRETDWKLYRSLLAGERDHYELEKRYVRKDGQTVWGHLTVSLVRHAADGSPLTISMIEDITEKRKLEEQFRQSQKMEAIGQLAGGVAHDFNNILTVIQGYASLLLAEMTDSRLKECAQEIVVASGRATGLTRQLLLFSRKQLMQPARLNLNETVGHMTKMLQRILGEHITLHSYQATNLPLIQADAIMMEQVLLNLAVNSRDAMPQGGQLTITTNATTIAEPKTPQHPPASGGTFVCLSVADNGTGIRPEILSRIFDPFFTTKEPGKGTGLGLATVYGIVQQHRGWIDVASEMGAGTTFRIYLPAVEGPRPDQAAEPNSTPLPSGNETLLVVEDDSSLRALAVNVLERCGYTVLAAASGVIGLEVWRDHRDEIQLLLTDLVMPNGVTGHELARRLKSEKPELKIIYTSGYSAEFANEKTSLIVGANFLPKPYRPRELAQIIRDCLDLPS